MVVKKMLLNICNKFTICKNKIICYFFNHNWRYNFISIPNKAICNTCKIKAVLDLQTLEWKSVKTFEKELRTDDELCKKWHK